MRIRAAAAAITMAASVFLGFATAASAAPTPVHAAAPSRATLYAAAKAVEYENVGGSNYGHYKAKYPTQLNWSKDGCSVPNLTLISPALQLVLRHYSGVFVHSCDRHDFGYRNFGKAPNHPAPKFDPTRARKNSIDSQFQHNMKLNCNSDYGSWYEWPAKEACYKAADTFYYAVSHYGDKAFFG